MSAAAAELATLFGDLYDSNIDVEISWLNNNEWCARLGDPLAGFRTEQTFRALGQAVEWLRAKAIEIYPNSEFSKKYWRGFG